MIWYIIYRCVLLLRNHSQPSSTEHAVPRNIAAQSFRDIQKIPSDPKGHSSAMTWPEQKLPMTMAPKSNEIVPSVLALSGSSTAHVLSFFCKEINHETHLPRHGLSEEAPSTWDSDPTFQHF